MAINSTVVIFILIRNNKILVEKRPVEGFENHQYLIPGGAINNSEGIEGALKREMMEELGVTPRKFELLTQEEIPGLYNNILKPFVVSEWQGEVPPVILDKEDPHPLEWVEIETLLTTPNKGSKKIIQALKKYLAFNKS